MYSRLEAGIVRDRMAGVWHLVAIATAALFCLAASVGAAADGRFQIVSRGQARAEIVVQEHEPLSPVTFAAQELQRYVKQMTGADLPIVRAASKKPAIVLKLGERDVAQDRYYLRTDGNKLEIEGASPRAVLFGVYDLLERLGCGWCVPGDDTVPKRDALSIAALQVDVRPAFAYRMMLDFPLQTVAQTLAIADWIAKNRMNWVHECPNAHGEPTAWYDRRDRVAPELKKRGLRLIVGGHTMHTWLPETQFTAHPDWFASANGERKPRSLCISNPEMTTELIRNMQKFLDRCPEVDVIDLWHPDGDVFCHCAKCTHGVVAEGANEARVPTNTVQSAYAITYVEFVNCVAAAIATSHPNVMVGPLIYSQTDHAMPDGAPALADNVFMGVAHFFRDSYRPLIGEPKSAKNLRFLGIDLTWMANAKHFYVYEYYNGWTAPYIYPGAQVIVEDLRTLRELQVQGVSSDMYGYSPINMYVAARALWSPDLDWKNVVRDFCSRYYGDVAAEMAENEIRLESGIYGLAGYQGNGARDPESATRPASGRYLEQQRPAQIAFHETMISRTKDPKVKERLQRALNPWELWDKEPRFWAFPEFKD